jgi:putative N-acetylmannosamine-6-phosphate epimerase
MFKEQGMVSAVGTAITRPQEITKNFAKEIEENL